ncbi:MAG: twin-arginine translocation signal domain-containing protein, partial [Alphaproteobacteria bacterium]
MLTRRDFLQVATATAALLGGGGSLSMAASRQTITQKDLLAFKPVGQVTLLHLADIHAQLRPLYFREPSVNLGVGQSHGLPP